MTAAGPERTLAGALEMTIATRWELLPFEAKLNPSGPIQAHASRPMRAGGRVDARFATSAEGVYSAGDACRGASLIVWAISDGREAARALDAYLVGETHLPTRGAHQPFGGR